ncbi:MAG: hypothetical protein ABW007_05040 [Chitinophagaceae bacterium]
MQYQKEDMIGEFYQWEGEKMPDTVDRTPSRRAFDRFNGHHVLYIINYYVTLNNKFSKEYCQVLEKKISQDLPIDLRSELSVFNWIKISSENGEKIDSVLNTGI